MDRRDFIKQAAAIGGALGGGILAAGLGDRAVADPAGSPLRPPGARSEKDFLATCLRCMRCVDVCPNHCLEPMPVRAGGGAGTPTMHMRKAACMLCLDQKGEYLKCTEVCPSGALQLVKKEKDEIQRKVRIGVAQVDTALCYSYNNWSCGACFRACPLAGEAMRVGLWERPTVSAEACVGCGCCERACIRYPHAIRVKTQVA